MSQFGLHHQVHHTNAGHTALLLPLALGSQAVLDHTEPAPVHISLLSALWVSERFGIYFLKSNNTEKTKQLCLPFLKFFFLYLHCQNKIP